VSSRGEARLKQIFFVLPLKFIAVLDSAERASSGTDPSENDPIRVPFRQWPSERTCNAGWQSFAAWCGCLLEWSYLRQQQKREANGETSQQSVPRQADLST